MYKRNNCKNFAESFFTIAKEQGKFSAMIKVKQVRDQGKEFKNFKRD